MDGDYGRERKLVLSCRRSIWSRVFEFIETVGIEQIVTQKVVHQGQYSSGG